MEHQQPALACSFCGTRADEVERLIAGPGIYICDRCVTLCNRILAEAPPPTHSPSGTARRPRRRHGRGRWWQGFLPTCRQAVSSAL